MPPHGPCGNPKCAKPEINGGQWRELADILPSFEGDVTEGAEYACKRAACADYFGLPVYGRKRQAAGADCYTDEGAVTTGVPVREHSQPYAILELLEISGVRCASLACCCLPAEPELCVCRHQADLKTLGTDARGNYLEHALDAHVEYIVFGKWLTSERDKLGQYGTHYIRLIDLLRVLPHDSVKSARGVRAGARQRARGSLGRRRRCDRT